MTIIADIPKHYTAIAEWLSCLLFVLLLRKRYSPFATAAIMGASLLLLLLVQYLIGIVPLMLWLPGMAVALLVMYNTILLCCRIPPADAGFYWASAFIAAEFAASLEWQFYSFAQSKGFDGVWVQVMFLTVFYGITFVLLFRLQQHRMGEGKNLEVTGKEVIAAAVVAVGAFLISNISYVYTDTPLSGRMSAEIFYIRTLVDFAGVVMLYSLQNRWEELQMKQELDAINAILQRQYEQYRQSRENIDIINRKYHDLKHQLSIIRLEPDDRKREEYLSQLESGLQSCEADMRTGNSTLDTILAGKQLYCRQHQITMTVVADGARLAFMDVMGLCSIFGNALDNAIESVEKLEDVNRRLTRVAVFVQDNFLMIRVENYFETPVKLNNGEFATTKADKLYHGYGIKSIRYTAEKYGGSVSITTEDRWFHLRVLIPICSSHQPSDAS